MTLPEDREQIELVATIRQWVASGFATEISIAKEVGVSRNTVNRWVNGKRAIKSGHRKLLAKLERAIWVDTHISPLWAKDALSMALLTLLKHGEDQIAQQAALTVLDMLPKNDRKRLDVILATLLIFAPLPVLPRVANELIEQGRQLAASDSDKARLRLFAANFKLKALRLEPRSTKTAKKTADELCDEYESIFQLRPNISLLFNALEVANEFSLNDRAVKILDRIHKIRDRGISDACKTGVFDLHESVNDPAQLKDAHKKWKDYISYLVKLPIYRDPNVIDNNS
jgi:transcriptional regulator with XRE-family HTH domain